LQYARHQIEQITFPRLSLEAGATHLPGRPLDLALKTRNLKQVTIQAWRFPSKWILQNERLLKDGDRTLTSTQEIV